MAGTAVTGQLARELTAHGYRVRFPPGRDVAVFQVTGLAGDPRCLMYNQTAADTTARHLRALSAELTARGADSDLVTSGYRPRLRLHLVPADLHPNAAFEDNVVAPPGADGCWLLWWPWVEQIADADDPGKAAEVICDPLRDDSGTDDAPGAE